MKIAFIIAAALGCGLAACNDEKLPAKTTEPVATGKPVATAGAGGAGPEAANELDVARYEDEVAVDHVPLQVKVPLAIAFRSYPKGEVIATLRRDEEVVQLSERYGFYLVTFRDPGNPSQELMGWVGRFAFEEPPPIKKKLAMPRCAIGTGDPGTVVVVLEDPPRCAYVCKNAAECATIGGTCEARIVVSSSGEIAADPSYTTVCTTGSGSHDAGVGARPSRPSLFGSPYSAHGKCPRFFTAAPKLGALCYRYCKTDVECPVGSTCMAFGKTKLCARQRSR